MMERKRGTSKGHGPVRFLAIACALTAGMLAWLGWGTYRSYQADTLTKERDVKIEQLRGRIVHLDEVLTMSARMGVQTGDLSWEKRYRRFKPKLDEAIKETKAIGRGEYGAEAVTLTDAANQALVEMEHQAFDLVRQGRLEEAQAVLLSDEYEKQKNVYARGITRFAATRHVDLRLQELRSIIVHIDEVLTMSAHMAAATGEPSWEDRYRRFEPQLEAAINEAIELAPESRSAEAAAQTDAANIALVDMENQAFDLVRAGRLEEARAILFGNEYRKQKRIYANGMKQFDACFEERASAASAVETNYAFLHIASVAVALLALLVGWGVLLPALYKWQAELAAKNRGIAEQATELTTLNATLDQRVVERTKDLEASQTAALNMMADVEQARAASEKMEERLRHSQKMKAVGSLVAGVAHDYNNQLQAVLASLEMALEDLAPDSPTYVAVDAAERAARRSLEITKGLLGFSRDESEAHARVDLEELLCEAGQVLQRVLPDNIRFKLSHDQSLWPIMSSVTQIQQVLMNLAVNARDAMPAGGTLTITATNRVIDTAGEPSRPKQVVLISISDTGIGMKPETVSRIFDPFFTTKERGRGTGLGLSLTHGIIKSHGGWIEVRSAVGEGTTVDIFLPAVESAECERRPQESTVCAASSPLSALFNNQETRLSEE